MHVSDVTGRCMASPIRSWLLDAFLNSIRNCATSSFFETSFQTLAAPSRPRAHGDKELPTDGDSLASISLSSFKYPPSQVARRLLQ